MLSVQNFARNVEVNAKGLAKIVEAKKVDTAIVEEFKVNLDEKLRLQKDLIRLMREESDAIATRNV